MISDKIQKIIDDPNTTPALMRLALTVEWYQTKHDEKTYEDFMSEGMNAYVSKLLDSVKWPLMKWGIRRYNIKDY